MDLASLAIIVAKLVVPVLPRLLSGGKLAVEEATKEIGKKIGDGGAEAAKGVWATLLRLIGRRSAARAAAGDVVENSKDADAQAAFRRQIFKLLESDPDLKAALERQVLKLNQSSVVVKASGAQAVAVNRASNTTISTGNTYSGSRHSSPRRRQKGQK
jgi:hypothetical protein